MMPYLMRSRSESVVFHEQLLHVRETLAFIERWNAATPEQPIKLFDIVTAAIAQTLRERPGLDRFVAGGKIYQRRQTHVSFAVKRAKHDYAALRTVKLLVQDGESFTDFCTRLRRAIDKERCETQLRPVEKEVRFFLAIPGALLAAGVWLARMCDWWGLFPAALIKNDPLYASVFVANVGSLGISRVRHHLYEYGTVSLFCAVSEVADEVIVGPLSEPVTAPVLRLNWTFDERINDAHYCVESLRRVHDYVVNPNMLLTCSHDASLDLLRQTDEEAAQQAWLAESDPKIPMNEASGHSPQL